MRKFQILFQRTASKGDFSYTKCFVKLRSTGNRWSISFMTRLFEKFHFVNRVSLKDNSELSSSQRKMF